MGTATVTAPYDMFLQKSNKFLHFSLPDNPTLMYFKMAFIQTTI
jgi:hypothetical protein